MKVIYIIFIFIFILNSNCSINNKSEIENKNRFVFDLPDSSFEKANDSYHKYQSYTKMLGLNQNYSNIDSFEIRLWFNYLSLRAYPKLIIIRKVNGKWNLLSYIWYCSYPDNINKIKHVDSIPPKLYQFVQLDSCFVENCGIPESGWTDFIENIQFDSLCKIDTQEKLEIYQNRHELDCSNIHDGVVYNIEFITNKYYKFIRYHCPGGYSKCLDCKSHKMIYNFINLLWKEFSKTRKINFHLFKKEYFDYRC